MDLEQLGILPIQEDKRAGADIKYEPEYDEVQQEIDKLSSPTASSPTDWEKVAKISGEILEKKSKDLIITTYLCISLLHLKKLEGLFLGTKILKDILYNFWEDLYPPKKRMKGRKNALIWWKDELIKFLDKEEKFEDKQNKKQELLQSIEDIDKFIEKNIPDGPTLLNLKEKLKEIIISSKSSPATKPPPKEDKEPDKVETNPPSPQDNSTPAEPSIDSENLQDLMDKAFSLLNKASLLIAKEKPYWPELFRLNRITSWLTIEEAPVAQEKKTLLPPPDTTIVNALKNLYQNKNWPALLETAESYVPQFLFWLDLSRYSKESLENLQQQAAALAIEQESKWFLTKLPGIEQLCFSDGTPFADAETQKWLKKLTSTPNKQMFLPEHSVQDELFTQIDTTFKKIKNDFNPQGMQVVLLKLQEKISNTKNKREKMFWYIKLVNFLLEKKQVKICLPYVHKIFSFIENYKLEEWEPDLAVDGLVACMKVLQSTKEHPFKEVQLTIYDKLSLLNPAIALNFL